MRTVLLLCILLIMRPLYPQENTGIIYPGHTFQNKTADTVFYLPKQKLESIMYREEIRKEMIQVLKAEAAVRDSLILLKTREAEEWYKKLLLTDALLEESEITRLHEQQKARRKHRAWFGVGGLLGLVVGLGF